MKGSKQKQSKNPQQFNSNFTETKEMLRNYIYKKRYAYAWEQLLKFYNRTQSSLSNHQILQCVKIGFFAYQRQFYHFLKRKNNGDSHHLSNIQSHFKILLGLLGSLREVLLVQMHIQDPQYFNMFFRMENDTLFKKFIDNKNQIFYSNPEKVQQKLIKPQKELQIFLKNLLKTIILNFIFAIKYRSLNQILVIINIADPIIKNLSNKSFSSQIISYQLLKFDPSKINLIYQFPIQLFSKIYLNFKKDKSQKSIHLYTKCQKYTIFSIKHLELSRLQLKTIYEQFNLLHQSVNIPINPKFNQLLNFVGSKLNKDISLRQQIIFIITKYIPDIYQYCIEDHQQHKQYDKQDSIKNKVRKTTSNKIQNFNTNSKGDNQGFIIQNILKIGCKSMKKSHKEKINQKKELFNLFNKLKFNQMQILNQSSDEQGQIHCFQSIRKQRIMSLDQNNAQNNYQVQKTQNIEQDFKDLSQQVKKNQYAEEIHFLDQVVNYQINKELQETINYKSVQESKAYYKELTTKIQSFSLKKSEQIRLLREKSKNKFYKQAMKSQIVHVHNLKGNWIKSKPISKLKIMDSNNRNFLKNQIKKEEVQDNKYKKGIMLSDSFDKLSKRLNFRLNGVDQKSNTQIV